MRIIAPNRYDALTNKQGVPERRFITTMEDIASNLNDLMALPINTQDSDYTLLITDAGQILCLADNTTFLTYTIPDNDSVTFDIGTQIEIQNDSIFELTISITTDTLTSEAGLGTGTRTVAASGSARLLKVAETEWKIRGEQLT